MQLTLYYHPLSSFCHKVLIALYEHGIDFERRVINLGDDADRAALAALWPVTRFPVLRDHARQRNLAESSIIIEYLERHGGGHPRLIPAHWDEALETRLWDRIFDQYVQRPVQDIVADTCRSVRGDMTPQRATLVTSYRMINERMVGRTWVAAERFSMADCAAAPALFYAMTIQPFPDEFWNLRAYFERLMARLSVQRVLAESKPYFALYPFAVSIPERFR